MPADGATEDTEAWDLNVLPVTIEHIYISSGHNYFGKPKNGPGTFETHDVDSVHAHAGLGLQGDRYFAVPAHYKAQVTFINAEVLDDVRTRLGLDALDPVWMRRNIVIRGVPLLQLIGQDFSLDFGDGEVYFTGASHCAPCAWMDAQIAEGARNAMRGRGGLRGLIVTDGTIRRGAALLRTNAPIDMRALLDPLRLPAIP